MGRDINILELFKEFDLPRPVYVVSTVLDDAEVIVNKAMWDLYTSVATKLNSHRKALRRSKIWVPSAHLFCSKLSTIILEVMENFD